ncbi:hypothetical protein [Desulfoluna sp.]|uniref:hypothetical protein n=1 Tax=Desulfoluna sp. TaxID=2045199 RepID=UPI00261BBE81|nr:hypothetical protein [Desulfoluna sp.]
MPFHFLYKKDSKRRKKKRGFYGKKKVQRQGGRGFGKIILYEQKKGLNNQKGPELRNNHANDMSTIFPDSKE